jgi:3-hydroxybutyryl-CoA dehydratase
MLDTDEGIIAASFLLIFAFAMMIGLFNNRQLRGQQGQHGMTERKLARPGGLFFEEFMIGDQVESVGRTITETDIVNFAALTGDWNLIHTDAEYSKEQMFGQRVAHGLLVLSIASGQAVRLGFMEETILAFRGLEWKFARPVFIGDTIRLRVTVEDKKELRRAGGGLVNFKMEVVNQKGAVCQRGMWEILCKMKS